MKMARLVTRSIAVAIAIAGVIDPAFTAMRAPENRLVAIDATAHGAWSPDGQRWSPEDQTVLATLAAKGTIEVRAVSAGRAACSVDERCVVVADGTSDVDVPSDLAARPSLIALRSHTTPNVAIRSVQFAPAHVAAASTARVELSSRGAAGQTVTIRLRDGEAIVGAAQVTLESAERTTIDVPWWPIEAGAQHVRIEASPVDREAFIADNVLDAGADVAADRMRVLVFDARPSWSSTFVRRALEDDPRFHVEHRARVAPALSEGTSGGRLDAASLDTIDALVIGALDALTADDVALIDRFVRIRGGSLILLPEARPAGPASRWFAAGWTEKLREKPEAIGPLHASEWLARDHVGPFDTIVAASSSSNAIVSTPAGEGRIVISGAMDAWRYRDRDSGAFDRFWTSLIADAAIAGTPLRLDFDRDLGAAGTAIPFTLRRRSLVVGATHQPVRPASAAGVGARHQRVEASAVGRCGDGLAETIRLWPSGALGEFTGAIPSARAGQCVIEATVDDRQVSAAIAIADKPNRGVERTLAHLESTLSKGLPAASTARSVVSTVHPMRSPWWMLPFAGCLSIEWWLRRRAGLR